MAEDISILNLSKEQKLAHIASFLQKLTVEDVVQQLNDIPLDIVEKLFDHSRKTKVVSTDKKKKETNRKKVVSYK